MTQPRLLGGRYELDGVIGRGGMAEVYKARDLRLDRIVAIKTLRSDLARDPTFQARFRREAQSAASLNHPSVIAVYDTGEDMMGDSMIPYIVMEFVEGQTLRELLRENRRLVPERALEITDGILRALDYSHRAGIIHRDIKPANVMLTRAREVKVMDFGIARAMADSAATMTQTAQVIGTAQYLSPEQARGERVDARSDLYSTGCVLYELLTGRPPFTGDSPVAIAYQHVREEPVPPSQVDPNIPQWCDAIVLKAMTKDANARYQSANEFRADIQRAMQGQPVSATASSTMVLGHGAAERTSVMPPSGGAHAYGNTQQQQRVGTGYGDLPPVRYDDEEYGRRGGGGKKAALWIGLAILFIGGAALIGMMLSSGGGGPATSSTPPVTASTSATPDQVQVPDESNKSQADATADLQKAGFQIGDINSENSDTVDKGNVTRTDPQGGQQAAKGSKVNIFISKGKAKVPVQVANVVGQTFDQAKSQLEGQQLNVKRGADQPNDQYPKGTVISQDPAAGSNANQGDTVTLVVSSGSANVAVPDVVNKGMSGQAACNKIVQAGLRCVLSKSTNPDPTATNEIVYQTSPPAGSTLARNETVTVYVYTPNRGGLPSPPGQGPGN